MPTGQNEQQLRYRVEIDRNSLADTVQTVREAIGQGLTSAVQGVQGGADRVASTAAVAMASAQGHLGFLSETRARLTPDRSLGADSSGTMTLMRSMAIRAGMVDPSFSSTRAGLSMAANSTMSEFRITAEEKALGAVNGLASVIGFAGTVANFVPGIGAPVKAALDAALFGLEGSTMGWERSVERRRMQRMLGRYGASESGDITREFEDRVNGLANVSYAEASAVARTVLANVGPENLDRTQVRRALNDAIGNYQAAGKLLGMDREQALAETGAMARMGIWKADEVQGLLARTASAAMVTGMDPAALAVAGRSFMEGSAAIGYGAFSSGLQFQAQTGMIGEALRAGQMSRGMLTAAAGFAGPQANQVVAASQNYITEMRAVSETGIGRMISAGILAGGRGDIQALAGSAAGMSLQERMEFELNRYDVDPTRIASAAGATFTHQLGAMGVAPTQEALAGLYHAQLGMSLSAANLAAFNQIHPEIAERESYRARSAQQFALVQGGASSAGFGRFGAEMKSGFGDLWDSGIVQAPTETNPFLITGTLGVSSAVTSSMRWATGHDYRGFRGYGRALKDAWTGTVGTVVSGMWDNWSFTNRPGRGFLDMENQRFFDPERPQILGKTDVNSLTGSDLIEETSRLSSIRLGTMKDYGSTDAGKMVEYVQRNRANLIGEYVDKNNSAFNNRISGVQYALREPGKDINLGTSQAEAIFGAIVGDFAYAGTKEHPTEAAIRKATEKIMLDPSLGAGLSNKQARQVVEAYQRSGVFNLIPDSIKSSIQKLSIDEKLIQGSRQILADEESKKHVAGMFVPGSRERAIFESLDADKSGFSDVTALIRSASRRGQLAGHRTYDQAVHEALMTGAVGDMKLAESKKEEEDRKAAIKAQSGKGDSNQQLAELVLTLQETNTLLRQQMGRQ